MPVPPSAAELRPEVRRFVAEEVAPYAGDWERDERIPESVVARVREKGWLGAPLPSAAGGAAFDPLAYGVLTEEIARGCSSLRTLLTVHDMSALAVWRWGSPDLRAELAGEPLAGGRQFALGLTEAEAGSDASAVRTAATADGDGYVLDGTKRWISFGQSADEVLVLARAPEGLGAFLVAADTPGFRRRPMTGVLGTAASMLAEIELDGCRVPRRRLVGRLGFGLSHVVATALDMGRFSVAWGALGLLEACLAASRDHTASRIQFGAPLADHQLVRRELAEMIVAAQAGRLLCERAAELRRGGDPESIGATLVAKYFTSRAAARAARAAVQLHGAEGLGPRRPVARWFRDAQVLEIIEGTTQILQLLIAAEPESSP